MNKNLIALLLFSGIFASADAQDRKNVIQAGVGLGNRYEYPDKAKGMPTLHLTYERLLPFKAGPGYFGAGITASYRTMDYDDYDLLIADVPDYEWKFSNAVLALRAAYHLGPELIKVRELDLYGAVQTGARFYRVKNDAGARHGLAVKETGFYVGFVAGVRYYLTPGFALFSEAGYDVTWLKLGAAARF